jgi:formate-dependent nitrite reductase membrane component NrfD
VSDMTAQNPAHEGAPIPIQHLGSPSTVSDGVRDSYYGLPVIKAPHWGWLVVVYFFLGGIAGGSYSIGALADATGKDPAIARASRYVSMAALLPSPVLLILDLGRPERFLHMLRVVKLSSPLSIGSWTLALFGTFASAVTGLQLLADLMRSDVLGGMRRAIAVAGLPFSLILSGYTGVLLAATNVPLWARNYLLLGPTFVTSAFSTSLAAISLVLGLTGDNRGAEKRLARADALCLAAEGMLLLSGIARLGKLGRPLTSGSWGAFFWPVTFFAGIVAPLGLQVTGGIQGTASRPRRTLTALLVLGGGFSLRTVMIFAGRKSAHDPQYYFEYTRKPQGRD